MSTETYTVMFSLANAGLEQGTPRFSIPADKRAEVLERIGTVIDLEAWAEMAPEDHFFGVADYDAVSATVLAWIRDLERGALSESFSVQWIGGQAIGVTTYSEDHLHGYEPHSVGELVDTYNSSMIAAHLLSESNVFGV